MSEEKKKGILQTVVEFLELEEVETGKPPAKTQETPVHVEVQPELPSEVQPPEDTSAIEVKMPDVGKPSEIGEEGKRRRLKFE